MQLLLQFYADSFETLQVMGTNVLFSVLQLLFFSCTKVIVGYLYCLVKDAILLLTLCTRGNRQMGNFTNNEDPDEMLQKCCISSGSTLFVKVKKICTQKNTIFL